MIDYEGRADLVLAALKGIVIGILVVCVLLLASCAG
jgi:hypothetical protein